METIYVSYIGDPESVVKAFQQALDIVVANDGVKKLLAEKYNPCRYQKVYWREGEPPLGCVTMLTTGHRHTITVFVTFKHPGRDIVLHKGFTQRAYLGFEKALPPSVYPFTYNQGEYRATVALPAVQFLGASRLQMLLKA